MILRPFLVAFALVTAGSAAAQTPPPSTALDPGRTAPRPGQRPHLTPEQRSMIFSKVHQDKSKAAKGEFRAEVGADVPPSLELHALPDDAIMKVPVTRLFRVVVVKEKVVLVDPTTMRVVDVIER